MTRNDLSGFDIDDARAQAAVQEVRSFVHEFKARREAGELRRLLEGERLTGGILEQAPEDFTEHELVEPCLDALGYSDGGEGSSEAPKFRRQPSRFPKSEQKRPDYELRNVHEQLTCIVEVKAINRERSGSAGKATENIETYLEDNTFCKHARGNPPGVLVGIATDGFRWVLWFKDLNTGEIFRNVSRQSILEPVRDIAASELPEFTADVDARRARPAAREKLESQLVKPFSRENLARTVGEHIDRISSEQ